MGFISGFTELFKGKKAEAPDKPQPPTVESQIAAHQATINESQDKLAQISMEPTPLDKPIIEAEQAKIASAREALANLQPQPTPPETPPPGITQIPLAEPQQEPAVEKPKVA